MRLGNLPIQKKLNFINKALEYGKVNSKLLITFPPFYSPFGLHQQVLLKSIIKYVPFLSSISPKILIPILIILNESSKSIDDKLEFKEVNGKTETLHLEEIKNKLLNKRNLN